MYCPKQYASLRTFEPEKSIMVAYFSASGVTKRVARGLAYAIDATEYEIVPQIPYTEADLDWRDRKSRSSVEMHDPDSRPLIARRLDDVSAHDIIFLGFPIWWGTAPSIIKTFLESHDLYKKRIVLFATSGGSGMGNTASDLKESAGRGEIVGERILTGRESDDELREWARQYCSDEKPVEAGSWFQKN